MCAGFQGYSYPMRNTICRMVQHNIAAEFALDESPDKRRPRTCDGSRIRWGPSSLTPVDDDDLAFCTLADIPLHLEPSCPGTEAAVFHGVGEHLLQHHRKRCRLRSTDIDVGADQLDPFSEF